MIPLFSCFLIFFPLFYKTDLWGYTVRRGDRDGRRRVRSRMGVYSEERG